MKININQIPPEGITLEKTITPSALDLDTGIVKLEQPIAIKADVHKISNTVMLDLALHTSLHLTCSRCLEGYEVDFDKEFNLNFPVSNSEYTLDLSKDIREEIVLDYPIKPLCKAQCKGLCPRCGENLNQGRCKCKNPEE